MTIPDSRVVAEAADRVAPWVRRTPVITSRTVDAMAGRRVHFKCENLQRTGSFKYRGATNAVQLLTDEAASRGVVTHSSGNHAQALALAGRDRGLTVRVVMPRGSAAVKRDAVIGYGGTVIDCERSERAAVAERVARETGGTLIPPFDDWAVVAGQGTCTLELLQDVLELAAVVVPVGGGGLISGACLAAEFCGGRATIFGAEPLLAGDAALSQATGERQPAMPPESVADGLLTGLGERTWPVVRDRVRRVFTVSETQIIDAMRLCWERMKLVIEPSAAVGLAVVLSDEFVALPGFPDVGVILCGGNIDLSRRYW